MKENIPHHPHKPRHYMVADMHRAAPVPPIRHRRMPDPTIPTDILHPNYPPFHSNGISWTDEGLYNLQREERFINNQDCGHHACDNSMEPLDWDEVYGKGMSADEIAHRYTRPAKEEKDKLDMQDITEQQVDDWFDDDSQAPSFEPDITNEDGEEEEIPDYINNI